MKTMKMVRRKYFNSVVYERISLNLPGGSFVRIIYPSHFIYHPDEEEEEEEEEEEQQEVSEEEGEVRIVHLLKSRFFSLIFVL